MTRTSQRPGQKSSRGGPSADWSVESQPWEVFHLAQFTVDLKVARIGTRRISVFVRQLESSRRGQYVCLCVSQLEDEPGADGERRRGELVQLREGSEG